MEPRIDVTEYSDAVKAMYRLEPVGLTLAVVAINGCNRIAIRFPAEVGSYQHVLHHLAFTEAAVAHRSLT